MQHFRLVYTPFPEGATGKIHGAVKKYEKYCIILIDSNTPKEMQAKSLRHELAHIALGHLEDTTRELQEIEAEADSLAERMQESEFNALMQWELKGGNRQCG